MGNEYNENLELHDYVMRWQILEIIVVQSFILVVNNKRVYVNIHIKANRNSMRSKQQWALNAWNKF